MSTLCEELYQRRARVLGDICSIRPIIYSNMAAVQVGEAVLLLVLPNIRVGLTHFSHGICDDLRIPFIKKTLLLGLTGLFFNVPGQYRVIWIRMDVGTHYDISVEAATQLVRIHQRS